MGPAEQAYDIQTIGYWPYEIYKISPIASQIDPTLGYVIFENNFPYYNNVGNNFKGYIDYDFRTESVIYNRTAYRYQIDLNSGDSFYFSVSTTRKYFDGYVYNKFLTEFDPNDCQKGYVLYPTRLFLKPIEASKTISGWRLQTSAILLSAVPYYFQTFDHNLTGQLINKEYYSNYTGKIEMPISPASAISLSYQICASQQFNNKEILRFTETYNPYQYNVNLESSGTTIKPDSTHLYYKHYYYSPSNVFSEISERPAYNLDDMPYTVYILKYTPNTDPNIQTFLMLQSAINTSKAFNTYNNCVLTAVLNLNTTNFKYFAATRYNAPGLEVSVISGAPNSFIGAKYITDSITFKNTNESVYDTVTYTNDVIGSTLFGEVSSDQTGFDRVTWDLKYPPHYYNFNLIFKDASYYNQGSQECYLTFKLSADPISSTTDTVILSTYIYSDFQLLKLDLPTYGVLDYIKFDITTPLEVFLSALCCYYGENDTPYYALAPTWIPAVSANLFKVTYPKLEYGEIDVSIFPSLSTLAGFLQPYFSTDIVLNKGGGQSGKNGTALYQTIVTQKQDYIETYLVDSTIVESVTGLTSKNPSRSLSGSNIAWFWTPQDSYIELHSSKTLSSIYCGQSVLFSPETYQVALSGYGPQTIVLTVSSQKYDEVSSVISVSSLFDIFLEKRFIIGPYQGLNNENFTRSITLTAAVPYKNRTYPIPDNYPIYWVWQYDADPISGGEIYYNWQEDQNAKNSALSSYDLQNNIYDRSEANISNSISGIKFLIQTPQTNLGEVLHYTDVRLFSNIDNIQGYYGFYVDEFPDETVLDSNFYTYYRNIDSAYIGSTYTSNTLTRPLDTTAKYDFKLNNNLLNRTSNTELIWTVRDDVLPLSSLSGISMMSHDITSSRITYITLSALHSIAAGWVSGHNVSKTLTVYSLPSTEFNQPLLFNIYPEFYWISGRNLNISDTSNYTNAVSPTAYQYITSNTYNFWVSANKTDFDDYRYSIGTPQTSSISLLNIPYDSRFLSTAGLPIALTAFGKEFPSTNGLFYQISSNTGLVTKTFNITSQSIPFNTGTVTINNSFYRSPKLVPYNSSVFTFSATITSLNIDTLRYLYVKQNIYSNPINSPDQPNGGTIAYTLSSKYWTATSTVNAIDGEFRIFSLSIGDSYEPLTIDDKDTNTMYLTASAYIYKIIPETTFDNYPTYTSDKNLWSSVGYPVTSNKIETIVTYTTSGNTGLYISDYYALTGYNINFEIDKIYYGPTNVLSYYNIDYSDGFSQIFYSDETANHSYFSAGTYNITLSSVYESGDISVSTSIKPIVIYNEWPKYDQSEIRFLSETSLILPYTKDQIDIQPNEFGNVDIFNTAISRLYQNLEYIISNTRTINTDSPTDVYGWIGTNSYLKSSGIAWHTADQNSNYYNNTDLAVSEGSGYFSDIRSVSNIGDILIVLDGNQIRYFINGKIPKEYTFSNYEEFSTNFLDINYLDTNDAGNLVFIIDVANNKVHRIELDIAEVSYIFDILDIGGFGSKDDTNKFNSPSKLVYQNSYVYVLDYNNHCIKKYTEQLTWIYTYYSDVLLTYPIENFDVHKDTGFVYLLASDYTLYIFDGENSEPFSTLYIGNNIDTSGILDFRFDESGEFFYVLTENRVYKFSASGIYIGVVNVYSGMKQIKKGPNRTILTSTNNYILKSNDIVEMFGIGDGLSKTRWSLTDLTLTSDEFAYDINYNRCLQRLVDNVKNFRDTLDSKFVLATESTSSGSVTYFAKQPIKISERPVFSDDVENNKVKIGVNELHITQVFNREFAKIYDALESLRSFLDIKTVNASTSNGCQGVFCWSWKAMSCYNLTLPVIKLCNINPITFAELKSSFLVNYAPTKSWGEAISNCCESKKSPLS
jgi:hypothetical protein